ncbi:MAG: lipid droplet-associated protein [Mycobacteriaceae bacterium]|nr:lipid droplet-associated protein [Mycobacteriaceae bacterium]MBV9638345.1 lipid droplet-associated protein [Mycobacteriaceae bacterium]
MANAPYGVRLLVGAAAMFIEETRKLPQTLLMYPMTLASQAAHLVMRFQQNVADLVIKGDETLDALFPHQEEQPEWATFDEDVADELPPAPTSESDRQRLTEGRFALYSGNSQVVDAAAATEAAASTQAAASTKATTKPTESAKAAQTPQAAKASPKKAPSKPRHAAVEAPDIAVELDYDALTLAQLRARLQSLSVADLDALLAYEVATKARAPFQTLLANRITRATAK